jgi:hypothetical protein
MDGEAGGEGAGGAGADVQSLPTPIQLVVRIIKLLRHRAFTPTTALQVIGRLRAPDSNLPAWVICEYLIKFVEDNHNTQSVTSDRSTTQDLGTTLSRLRAWVDVDWPDASVSVARGQQHDAFLLLTRLWVELTTLRLPDPDDGEESTVSEHAWFRAWLAWLTSFTAPEQDVVGAGAAGADPQGGGAGAGGAQANPTGADADGAFPTTAFVRDARAALYQRRHLFMSALLDKLRECAVIALEFEREQQARTEAHRARQLERRSAEQRTGAERSAHEERSTPAEQHTRPAVDGPGEDGVLGALLRMITKGGAGAGVAGGGGWTTEEAMRGLVTAALTEQLEANGFHTRLAHAPARFARVSGPYHNTHQAYFAMGANGMLVVKNAPSMSAHGEDLRLRKDDEASGEVSMQMVGCVTGEHIHGALREHREARKHWFFFSSYAEMTRSFEHFWHAHIHHVRATRRWLDGDAVVIAGRPWPAADKHTEELTDAAERLLDQFYEGWLQLITERSTPTLAWSGPQSAYDLARAVYVFTLVWMVGIRRPTPGARPLGLDNWPRLSAAWFTAMIRDLDPRHAYAILAADGISGASWKHIVPLNGWAHKELSGRAVAREARARAVASGPASLPDDHAAAAERDEGGRAPAGPRVDVRPGKAGGQPRA